MLPNGRGAFGDGVQPAGILPAQQQGIGKAGMAVFAQNVKQIRRADKARFKVIAAAHDPIGKLVGGLLRVVGQTEVRGKDALGLRPVFGIFTFEGPDDIIVEPFIKRDIDPQHFAGLDRQ